MRTHFFALNRLALEAIDFRLHAEEVDSAISGGDVIEQFFSPDMDPVLRDHIESYLFRAGEGWHWYAAEPLTTANAEKMAGKCRSILQEKFLSSRLDGAAVQYWNISWLSRKDRVYSKLDDLVFAFLSRHRS